MIKFERQAPEAEQHTPRRLIVTVSKLFLDDVCHRRFGRCTPEHSEFNTASNCHGRLSLIFATVGISSDVAEKSKQFKLRALGKHSEGRIEGVIKSTVFQCIIESL